MIAGNQQSENKGRRVLPHHQTRYGCKWTLRRTQLEFLCLIERDFVKAVEDMPLFCIPDLWVQALREGMPKDLVDDGIIVVCRDYDVSELPDDRKHLKRWKLANDAWRYMVDSPLHRWMNEASRDYPLPPFLL
jgi:hypothetical protein